MTSTPALPTGSPARPNRPANSNRRRWLPYAGAVGLVALIVAGLWPQPVPVETAAVITGPLRATVNEEGKTRIKQRYLVSAPIAGSLRRIPLKAGAEVQVGQTVLATIEPLPPALLDSRSRALDEARRDSARANLQKALAAHNFALSELRRYEKLATQKTVSAQEFEAAQWRETAAAREKSAAESALHLAEAELLEYPVPSETGTNCPRPPLELKSPVTGRVLRVFEESARVVSAGAALLEIGNPDDLEVVVEVLSRDGAMIAPGTQAEFEHWGGSPPLLGRVRFVEPAAFTKVSALGVEEQRVNVVADLLTPVEQRRGVGDNFRVEARIVVWETNQTVKVPAGALFRHGPDWAVFLVTSHRAHLRLVNAGQSSGTETQILAGLQPGEQVVLYPGSRVREGQRVKPIKI
jgi:HlyD family secretion protein